VAAIFVGPDGYTFVGECWPCGGNCRQGRGFSHAKATPPYAVSKQ